MNPTTRLGATGRRARVAAVLFLAAAATACEPEPEAPVNPTWAHVEPILRAQCNHCHGSTAATTGSKGALVYRFDFYDMTQAICGDAAEAMGGVSLARAWASMIRTAIKTPDGSRARMPPAPAEPLSGWERTTILRWAEQAFPPLGFAREGNRRPQIRVSAPPLANGSLSLTALVDDPDGEPVVGVIRVGDATLKMDRAGSFSATLDSSTWLPGRYPITAVVCDGWDSAAYRLGIVEILHEDPNATPVMAPQRP